MSDEPTQKLLLSAPEAAKALSISARTLWAYTQPRGDIPCVKLGARMLYSPDALAKWANAKSSIRIK
jgi:hypothetical protein